MNRAKNPLYIRHYVMMRKCYDDTFPDYRNAGAKGLTVARRWHNMDNFFQDIENQWGLPPGKYSQLARKDPLKGWHPNNIAGWEDHKFVANNRMQNHTYTYLGETLTVAEWARRYDINSYTLWSRLVDRGYTLEKALLTPVRKSRKI